MRPNPFSWCLTAAIALAGTLVYDLTAIAKPPVAKVTTPQIICDTTSNPPLTLLKKGTQTMPLLSWYDNCQKAASQIPENRTDLPCLSTGQKRMAGLFSQQRRG
jgi:hypothetical protein